MRLGAPATVSNQCLLPLLWGWAPRTVGATSRGLPLDYPSLQNSGVLSYCTWQVVTVVGSKVTNPAPASQPPASTPRAAGSQLGQRADAVLVDDLDKVLGRRHYQPPLHLLHAWGRGGEGAALGACSWVQSCRLQGCGPGTCKPGQHIQRAHPSASFPERPPRSGWGATACRRARAQSRSLRQQHQGAPLQTGRGYESSQRGGPIPAPSGQWPPL